MSSHEGALFISDEQRTEMLRAMTAAYYSNVDRNQVVFDTNRSWCGLLPAVAALFPEARVICCVRNPAWILDSIERAVQGNPLVASKLFGSEITNVFQRADNLITRHLLGPALQGLKQAWFGEHARHLIALRYESLASRLADFIGALYRELNEEPFPHDFDHIDYDEPEFDAQLGLPGFHRVAPTVQLRERETILPPELFRRHNENFWELLGHNPHQVTVL